MINGVENKIGITYSDAKYKSPCTGDVCGLFLRQYSSLKIQEVFKKRNTLC